METGYGSCFVPKGTTFNGWACGLDIVNNKFEMPERNVVCKAAWLDSIEMITYIGCVDGNCLNCSNSIVLNNYIDSDKWTYSNTKLVTFPVLGEDPAEYLENLGYDFDGEWTITLYDNPSKN